MNTLYLMEASERDTVYDPAGLSNNAGFAYQDEGDFLCLLDVCRLTDTSIEMSVGRCLHAGEAYAAIDPMVQSIAHLMSDPFRLHIQPHRTSGSEAGVFRILNVHPAEVRVARMVQAEHRSAFGPGGGWCRPLVVLRNPAAMQTCETNP